MTKNIRCPVIGFFGNEDDGPSSADMDAIEAVPREFHRYDGTGHAFQNFTNPEHCRERQSEDAWAKEPRVFQQASRRKMRPTRSGEFA